MEPKRLDICQLFAEGHSFSVPFFQRAYVWNEKLWNRFIRDMEYISCHNEEYFLGSIILKNTDKEDKGKNWAIIDGQQRLTTLAILYKILSLKCPNLHNPFDKRFRQDNSELTIYHSLNDKDAFEKVSNLAQDEEFDLDSDSNVIKAYNYIRKNLDLNRINLKHIQNRLWFIVIYLKESENEHKIFDTINSIGLSLNTEELLKNFLFSQETLNEYNKIWRPMFEVDDTTRKYWKQKTSINTSTKKTISDRFFHTLLQIIMFDPRNNISSEEKKEFRIYDEQNQFGYFQQVIEQGKWERIDFAELIVSYAQIYKHIFCNQGAISVCDDATTPKEPLKRLLLVVELLNAHTAIPYIMFVLHNLKDELERNAIFSTIESYIVRRSICKASNKNYSDLFTEGLIGKQILTNEALCHYLKSKKPDTTLHMPYDSEVSKALITNSINQNAAKCILYLIEANLREANDSQTILMEYSAYSLEHLMPQNWKKTWAIPEDLDELEKMEFENTRNKALKCLGNLALITQGLNSSISNSAWNTKLEKGLKDKARDLQTMIDVINKSTWDESSIESRSEHLADCANLIWENTISAGEEQEKQSEKQNDRKLYSVDDGNTYLPKNQFVYTIIKKILELHPDVTMDQLKSIFDDSILKQYKRIGFLCTEKELQNKCLPKGRKPTEEEIKKWYRCKKEEMLISGDQIKFAVSTQITGYSADIVKDIAEKENIQVLTKNGFESSSEVGKRRPAMNFYEMGLKKGQELTFRKDPNIKCKIESERKILYNGEVTYLTSITKNLLGLKQAVQPSPYWYVDGIKLSDIYDETYPLS